MSKGKIRHMFPGGNTSQGFFSYYDYILSQDEATRIICIKGGPGVPDTVYLREIIQAVYRLLLSQGRSIKCLYSL